MTEFSKKRNSDKWYNSDMIKLALFLFGGSSTGGLISFLGPTNVAIDNKLNAMEKLVISNTYSIEQTKTRMESYIDTHARQEEMGDKMTRFEFQSLSAILVEMKEDLKDLKKQK